MSLDIKMPVREQDSNKGTFGKVLNISGCNNYIGAAYLSSLAVLKAGAGLVALSSVGKVSESVSKLLPEAVYLSRRDAFKNIDKYTTLLIGCGLGTSFSSKRDLKKSLGLALKYDIPTVIDADGLNIMSKIKNVKLPSKTIITPHPAEAARLLGVSLEEVLNNLEEASKKLFEKYSCTVVLKTHRTIIYDGQRVYINQNGNSSLAKAGTGDVLAGIISGLLAQKCSPIEAARFGVFLHARAGELASEDLTEYSVLASDVIKYLPKAIKEIV